VKLVFRQHREHIEIFCKFSSLGIIPANVAVVCDAFETALHQFLNAKCRCAKNI
jgi:hypothetical protein